MTSPEVDAKRPQAAVIEIVERGRATSDTTGGSIVVPREVWINGQSVLTPLGSRIAISDISLGEERDLVSVTLTLVARRLTIAAEGDLNQQLNKEQA